MDRAAVAVGEANGEHRTGHAVGDQHATGRGAVRRASRRCAVADGAAKRLRQAAVGVAHLGGELGLAPASTGMPRQRLTATVPAAILAGPFEGDRIDQPAAGAKLHGLPRQMLDRDPDQRRARIMLGFREQPGDSRLLRPRASRARRPRRRDRWRPPASAWRPRPGPPGRATATSMKSTRFSAPPRPSTKREKARPAERLLRAQSTATRSAGRVMSSSWTTWVPGRTPSKW